MHSFMLSRGGRFTTFESPGTGPSAGQGLAPTPSTERDKMVGDYVDANNVYHAFMNTPSAGRGDTVLPCNRRPGWSM